MALSETAERLISGLDAVLPPGAVAARQQLDSLRSRLASPLRVAIAGQIKTGKSSLLNALIGEDLLPVGVEETTYNVTWLRYGSSSSATLRWSNGRVATTIPVEDLAQWVRRSARGPSADAISWIEVAAPCEILRRVELIDTPGLASSYGSDSRKTQMFLHLDDTSEPTEVDVAVFTLRRGLHEGDEATIRSFRHSAEGRFSPLNTLALLTQSDLYWPGVAEPLAAARRVATRLRQRPELRNSLYDVTPVASLLAAGPMLSIAERDGLEQLATMPLPSFARLTKTAGRFVSRTKTDCAVTADVRAALFRRLGLYGVVTVCGLARNAGVTAALQALRRESGVEAFMDLLVRVFAPRAGMLRMFRGLADLQVAAEQLARNADPAMRRSGVQCLEHIARFSENSEELLPIELIRHCARDDGELSRDEIEEIHQAVAAFEANRNAASRATTAIPETAAQPAQARRDYWRSRFNEARMTGSSAEAPARAMYQLLERLERPGPDRLSEQRRSGH